MSKILNSLKETLFTIGYAGFTFGWIMGLFIYYGTGLHDAYDNNNFMDKLLIIAAYYIFASAFELMFNFIWRHNFNPNHRYRRARAS